MSDDTKRVRQDFDRVVNMTASELTRWLDTDESKSVGQKKGGGESTGHESGREIVRILRTKKDDLTDDDLAQMKRVHGYVARHVEQRPDKPKNEIEDSAWRYSLMNWGHDPLK